MAKVVVRLPEPKKEYSEDNQRQINRALSTIIEQLNSTYLTQLNSAYHYKKALDVYLGVTN